MALLFSVNSFSEQNIYQDSNRCRNTIDSLGVTDIHTIMAMACSSYSNLMEERTPYNQLSGATYFHDWTISGAETGYRVSGFCSRKIDFKTRKILNPGAEINWTINKSDFQKSSPKISGKVGEKSLSLQFEDKNYFDPACVGQGNGDGIVHQRVLRQINIGEGIWDIVTRSNLPLVLIESKWSIEKRLLNFSQIELDYQARTFVGRSNRLIVSSAGATTELLVKFGNYLFKEEGDHRWGYDHPQANNAFYSPSKGRIQGCSILIYESELEQPRFIDTSTCRILNAKYLGK